MNFELKKTLITSATLSLVLAGCGSSGSSSNNAANNTPSHDGDIVKSYNEKAPFQRVNLLEGAIDLDGDILRVTDLTANITDLTGFDASQEVRVGVTPSELAPLLDTGDVREIIFTFNITDGTSSIPRSATFTVTGEDVAPVFNENFSDLIDTSEKTDINLLSGVTDGDEEPLSITQFLPTGDLTADLYSVDESTGLLTFNSKTVLDDLEPGEAKVFNATYAVQDHNHSLNRNLTLVVFKQTDLPAPPAVIGTSTVNVSTASLLTKIDLASPAVLIEPNGDQVMIDWSSIAPTNGGPALHFDRSQGTELAIDGIDFATMLLADETATFTYSYNLSDGNPDHMVESAFEITVTREAAPIILDNGGFENMLEGWDAGEATYATAAAGATQYGLVPEGMFYGAMAAGDKLKTALASNALEPGAGYLIEGRAAMGNPWGGYPVSVKGEVDGEAGATLASVSWFNHGANPRTHATVFEGAPSTTWEITAIDVENAAAGDLTFETDDIQITKYSKDPGNNLITQSNATFDSQGDWILVDSSSVMDGELHSGETADIRNILPLAAGTIENDKRYLLTMDITIENYVEPVKFRASILDPSDTSNETTATGGAFTGVFELVTAYTAFAAIIDVDRHTAVDDWAARALQLHIGTNIWGAGPNTRIDNVRLIELP